VNALRWFAAALALAAGAGISPAVLAASPHYTDLVLSDTRDGPAKASFKPQTAKIFLRSKIVDVPAGSTVKGAWIAEKTKVAPPNYKIDEKEMKAGGAVNEITYSISKPNANWPEGDYRVDLFINGAAAGNVKFRIAK
jgi:hypothetical protein